MRDLHSRMTDLPSLELVSCVVTASSEPALSELLQHRKLMLYNNRLLLIPEFIWKLRERSLGLLRSKKVVSELAEDAYSLTLAKFSNVPSDCDQNDASDRTSNGVKWKLVDCRNYYRVVLDKMKVWKAAHLEATELDEEQMVGSVIQRQVVKHFYLSQQEVRRSLRPFATRYTWKVGDNTVTLWYPKEIDSRTLRAWLEENFGKLNTISAEDRNRIQAGVDSLFGQGRWVTLDEISSNSSTSNPGHESSSGIATPSILAEAVSREKSNHIELLRPSVRNLGRAKLRELILRIFGDLADNVFKDQSIANDFGLSKATFSRFAGSKWRERTNQGEDVLIPDLWQNTARVVSSDPDFLDIAKRACLLESIGRASGPSESEQQNET